MKILALIPARMGSSRFPGKPMAHLLEVPMVEHVYKRVILNSMLTTSCVATCDDVIAEHIRSVGGRAIMTGSHHERASDRCAEALEIVEHEDGTRFDLVVMVQGDEPLVHPEMISEAVAPMLTDTSILVTNLLGRIDDDAEHKDPNCIKVVCAQSGDALYFSRQPIPTRGRVAGALGKQICVIPFRRDYLVEYTRLAPTPLEAAESVDMLRILEHGGRVRMVPTKHDTYSVDTESDRARAERVLRADPVYQRIFAKS